MTKYYVGFKSGGRKEEVFTSKTTPTNESHGHKYYASVGPFRTKAGAQVMVDGGYGNPHTQTVAQCEKIAAKNKRK